jgi:hypothetical protein
MAKPSPNPSSAIAANAAPRDATASKQAPAAIAAHPRAIERDSKPRDNTAPPLDPMKKTKNNKPACASLNDQRASSDDSSVPGS